MRFILAGIFFFSSMALADNQTIVLNPGSTVTVNPGAPTTVQCLGSSSTAKFHCYCSAEINGDFSVIHKTLGNLTNGGYTTKADCNQAILEKFHNNCWY